MSEPTVEILGAYKLEFTDEHIKQVIEASFGAARDETAQDEMLTAKCDELASVAAFEVRLPEADGKFDAGDFTPPGAAQVA